MPASPTRQPLALLSSFYISPDGHDSPHRAQAIQLVIHWSPMRRLSSQGTYHLMQTALTPQTQFATLSPFRKGYTVYRVIQDSFVRSLSPFSLVYLLSVLQYLFYLSPECRTSPCSRIFSPISVPLYSCAAYMYMVLLPGPGEWYLSNLWNLCPSPPSPRSCACRLKSYARFSPLGLKVKPFKTPAEVEAVEALRCGHTRHYLCLYIVYPGPHGCASSRVRSPDETHSAH